MANTNTDCCATWGKNPSYNERSNFIIVAFWGFIVYDMKMKQAAKFFLGKDYLLLHIFLLISIFFFFFGTPRIYLIFFHTRPDLAHMKKGQTYPAFFNEHFSS